MENKIIKYGDEEFIETIYNEISVIVDSNGYYQGSKICKDNEKDFYGWMRSKKTQELIEKYEKYLNKNKTANLRSRNINLIYKKTNVPVQLRGFYIHPKLVHNLCEWCDIEYAIKVAEIMDLINEQIKIRNVNLEFIVDELKETNKKLKEENETATNIIINQEKIIKLQEDEIRINNNVINKYKETLNSQKIEIDVLSKKIEKESKNIENLNEELRKKKDIISNLDKEIAVQNKLIDNKCVRTKTDSRKFRIYDITDYKNNEKQLQPMDEKCIWKVSGNQERLKYPCILDVVLVSAMHARFDIKAYLNTIFINTKEIRNIVNQSSKEYIYNYIINNLNPKAIVIDNIKLNI